MWYQVGASAARALRSVRVVRTYRSNGVSIMQEKYESN